MKLKFAGLTLTALLVITGCSAEPTDSTETPKTEETKTTETVQSQVNWQDELKKVVTSDMSKMEKANEVSSVSGIRAKYSPTESDIAQFEKDIIDAYKTGKYLSDIGNEVAKKVGLVFSLAQELRPIYESFKIDIPNSNDAETYELPMPATFVINKNAEVIFSFVDEDYTKRYEPEEIINIIKNDNKF